MRVALLNHLRRSVPTTERQRDLIMAPVGPVRHRHANGRMIESAPLDFRSRFANRIVEESWRERKAHWASDDIGLLLLDMLEDEMEFDWLRKDAVDKFKDYLALAFVAAGDVLPASQRTF